MTPPRRSTDVMTLLFWPRAAATRRVIVDSPFARAAAINAWSCGPSLPDLSLLVFGAASDEMPKATRSAKIVSTLNERRNTGKTPSLPVDLNNPALRMRAAARAPVRIYPKLARYGTAKWEPVDRGAGHPARASTPTV